MDQMNNNNSKWVHFYKGEHNINIYRSDTNGLSENEYNVTLLVEALQTANFKMIIRNLENDLESYTSYVTPAVFEDMKVKQNLLLNYSDLCGQIKSLLEQNLCVENRVILRLQEVKNNSLELGFFTKSDLKELIFLVVPFNRTSTDDLISYLKEKYENELMQKQMYQEKSEILNSELQNIHLKYRHLFSNFNTACQKMGEFEHQNAMLVEENSKLKQHVHKLESDNEAIMKNLNLSANAINNLEKYVAELKGDISGLQLGVTYYCDANRALKEALQQHEEKTVPKEKYLAISKMFSNAVVDLAKCQISLTKLASLHAGQKDENEQLQREILSLTSLITGLEKNLRPEDIQSEELANIRELIDHLELRAANAANYDTDDD